MPCPQDAKSAAIRGQNDLARTKVRAAIILTSYFCAFGTILDPVYDPGRLISQNKSTITRRKGKDISRGGHFTNRP